MSELVNLVHLILGVFTIIISFSILSRLGSKKKKYLKELSVLAALSAWLELFAAGFLYLVYYPATKAIIKSGSMPWAHSIFMESKEHLGILLPVIVTVGMGLVLKGKVKESERWWLLTIGLAMGIAVMGFIIRGGAGA